MNCKKIIQVDLLNGLASLKCAGQSALRAVLIPKIDFPYPKTSSLTYHMLNSDEQLKKGAS